MKKLILITGLISLSPNLCRADYAVKTFCSDWRNSFKDAGDQASASAQKYINAGKLKNVQVGGPATNVDLHDGTIILCLTVTSSS
jgi:hypothetical protein